jgi:hypothetical protein
MKRDWLQMVSNLAIIAGLIIVIYELNQSRNLAYGQILASSYATINTRMVTQMGENPQLALEKAVLNPESLTSQDAVVLDAHYNSIISSWYDVIRMMEATGIDRDWQGTIANSARETFSTDPGRRWLREWTQRPAWESMQPDFDQYYTDVWFQIEDVALGAIENASEDDGFSLKRRYRAILGNSTSSG